SGTARRTSSRGAGASKSLARHSGRNTRERNKTMISNSLRQWLECLTGVVVGRKRMRRAPARQLGVQPRLEELESRRTPTATVSPSGVLTITGDNNDQLRLAPGDPTTLQLFENPGSLVSGTPATPIPHTYTLSSLTSISVTTTGATEILWVDYRNGNPIPS